jgi:hypothetical protein
VTSQQIADLLLAEHQAKREARLRLSVIRSEQLHAYYTAERNKGVDALTANERMHEHAKYLNAQYERDLEVIREVIGRVA